MPTFDYLMSNPAVQPAPAEPSLLASENELALATDDPGMQTQLPNVAANILKVMQQQTVAVPNVEAPGGPPGLMLASGHRIYIDANHFVENATPESSDPIEVLAYQRAGERLILAALPKALEMAGFPPKTVYLLRAVTDYAGNYCGAHINVLTRRLGPAELAASLTPFLVTRFYANAGGWGPAGFVMSQKARAIHSVTSPDTRQNRGIVHLKEENLAQAGFRRIHLTSSDAPMSDWGTYLTVGCTALVLQLLDDGVCVGPAMALADPVAALQQLDSDYSWTTPLPLKCGMFATPIEIQDHYLAAAEAYIKHRSAQWMRSVVVCWRQVLDELRSGPAQLSTKLDPYIKMKLYSRLLAKHDFSLSNVRAWCGALSLVLQHTGQMPVPRRSARSFLRERLPFVAFHLLEERMDRFRLAWPDIPRALTLWHRLLANDLSYHRIDDEGIYWRLRRSGAVNSRLVDDADVDRAMIGAPEGTRAKVRERAIRELRSAEGGTANWCQVASPQRTMTIQHPFAQTGEWKPVAQKQPTPPKTGVRR